MVIVTQLRGIRFLGHVARIGWTGDVPKCESRNLKRQLEIRGIEGKMIFNPYPTAFPYGNGMVLHFYQQQESSTNKTVHRVINKGLKAYV